MGHTDCLQLAIYDKLTTLMQITAITLHKIVSPYKD
jgi:hypothetical protein